MSASQPSDSAVPGYPGLRPFRKGGDPRRNKGGLDPKTRRVRKKLATFDAAAIQLLGRMLTSDDPDDYREALKFWGKYRLPVPTEAKPDASNAEAQERVGEEVEGECHSPSSSATSAAK